MLASAMMYATIILGGVSVQVTGQPGISPMAPNADHPEVLTATSSMALNHEVLMNNGERWKVNAVPRRDGTGAITFTLRSASYRTLTFKVGRSNVDTPIWWTGTEDIDDVIPIPGNGEQVDEPPVLPPGVGNPVIPTPSPDPETP